MTQSGTSLSAARDCTKGCLRRDRIIYWIEDGEARNQLCFEYAVEVGGKEIVVQGI